MTSSELNVEASTALLEEHAPAAGKRLSDELEVSRRASLCSSCTTMEQLSPVNTDGLSSFGETESWSQSTTGSCHEAAEQDELPPPAKRHTDLAQEIADLMAFEGINVCRKGRACARLLQESMESFSGLPPATASDLRTYADTQAEQVSANLAGLIDALRPESAGARKALENSSASVYQQVSRQFRRVEDVLAEMHATGEAAAALRSYVESVASEAADELAGLASALLPELPGTAA